MLTHHSPKALLGLSLCLTVGCAAWPARQHVSKTEAVQATESSEPIDAEQSSQAVQAADASKPSATGEPAGRWGRFVSTVLPESRKKQETDVVVCSQEEQSDDSEPADFGLTPTPAAEETDRTPPPPASQHAPATETGSDGLITPRPAAYTLQLGDVIALADQRNPNVAVARERIHEAYALVDRAEVLWVPSLRVGANLFLHEGNVQDAGGKILSSSKGSWYSGAGALGNGANSPGVPGLLAQFHLTDAIFQPRIARHQAASRQYGAAAVRNDTLRSTSVAYLELVRAEHALAIALEAFHNTEKLVHVTEQFARTGQGLQSDYERMLAELAIRKADVIRRVEGSQVASARLAQFLHADPAVPILSGEPAIIPLPLMDCSLPARSYVTLGLSRRPELAEQQQLVCEAVERLNREKYAPLIPSLMLGASYGGMGGGRGGDLGNADDRFDLDAAAFWEIRNLGFGEHAARDAMSSGIRQARHRQLALMDQVAREVVEAHAQAVERERRIEVAKGGVKAAEASYQLNLQRIENIQGLPIESLQAVQALALARQTYLDAVIDYNVAQIELIRATGWFERR